MDTESLEHLHGRIAVRSRHRIGQSDLVKSAALQCGRAINEPPVRAEQHKSPLGIGEAAAGKRKPVFYGFLRPCRISGEEDLERRIEADLREELPR